MTLSDAGLIARPEWLTEPIYPLTLRSAELRGGTVAYIDEGEGPTILLVHAGMWSFIFRDIVTRLRNDFRLVAMDFPGYGLSPSPEGPELDLSAHSEVLGELVDHLHIRTATIVAHDLGGAVALGLAADRPGLVEGLVLANTFAWEPDRRSLRLMLRLFSSWPMTLIGTATNLVPRMTSTRFGVGLNLTKEERRAFRGPFSDRSRTRRFHRLLRSPLRSPEHFAAIDDALRAGLDRVPALSIFGEKNDPFGFQDRIAGIFDDHRGVVVEGGNHFPMMDDPDLFATSVSEWHADRVA